MIVRYLEEKYPWWEGPDEGSDWTLVICPFHNEDNPSASISDERDAFVCFACSYQGDLIKIFQELEEVNYRTAVERLEAMGAEFPQRATGKPSRTVFGRSGTAGTSRKVRFGGGS